VSVEFFSEILVEVVRLANQVRESAAVAMRQVDWGLSGAPQPIENRLDPKLLEVLPAVSAQEQDAPVWKVASQVKEQAGRSSV
jgi:hypothetical protein